MTIVEITGGMLRAVAQYVSAYDARADSEMLSTDFCRGAIPQRHGEWSTSPFRRVRETHPERTAKVPTRLIRIRLHPIRNDRGSCQQPGLPVQRAIPLSVPDLRFSSSSPSGSSIATGQAFTELMKAFESDFETHGVDVIEQLRKKSPWPRALRAAAAKSTATRS